MPTSQQQLPPGMFPLKALVSALVGQTNAELVTLADTLPGLSSDNRKTELLKYSLNWRQQWIKLLVTVRWAKKVGDLGQLMSVISFLDSQDVCFSGAADAMFKVHSEMLMAREPSYDIVTAVDILSAGNFQRLPSVIKKTTIPPAPLTEAQIESAVYKVEEAIRIRLLFNEVVPAPFRRNMIIDRGCVTFRVDNKFQVTLSLDLNDKSIPWTVVDLKILVNFVKEGYEGVIGINDYQLQGVIESASKSLLSAVEDPILSAEASSSAETTAKPADDKQNEPDHYPLVSLYNHLDHFVAQLQMEILRTQAFHLASSRWARQIAFDFISTGPERLLKIRYWCGTSGGAENGHVRMHFLDIKLSSAKQEKLLPKDMAIILSNTHSGFPSTFSKRPLQIRAYSVLYDSISGKSGPEIALVQPETLESFESELDIAMLDVESLLSRVCLVQGQCLVAEIAKALCVDFENVKVDLGYSSETDGRRNPELTCIYREDKAVRLCVDTRTGYIQVALLGGGSDTLMESTGISTLAQLGPVPATEGEKESVVAVRKMEESLQKDWRSVTGLIENLKYATYLEQIKMDVELSCSGVKFLDNLPFDESIVAAFCKPKVPKHIGVVRLEEWDQSFVAIAVGQHGELDSDNERKEMIAGPVYKAWIIMIGDGSTGSSSSSLKLYIPIKRDNISFFLNSERKEAETPRNEEHSKRRKKTTLSAEHLTDPGNQYLWTEMGSEVLSLIFSYARKQLAWLTVSAQVRDMALDYDLCFPQEYAMSPIPAHSLAMVAPKITIHPFYFDIERKIQAKSDPNLDRSATEEDKSSRYCFGNLYLGVEKAFSNGNTKETDMVVGRVRLTNEILPKVGLVKMDSPLASFDANHSVITLAIPHSDISAKEILRHWKGLAAIAEVASQIWTRQQWFLAHGIEIASYAVGMLTMRVEAWGILKFDGNGSSLLRLRWRRFVTDLVASKNPENEGGKAKGLDQFILESVCENGELEENVDEAKAAWIMKLQSLLNDCLDMVVFAKHLHPVSSLMKRLLEVEAISNSVENRVNGEQDVKVVAKSLSWIRFIQGVYGLDFYLFTNETMIVYDASAGGPDGIFDPALKPIPNFSRSTQTLPNAKPPLLEKLPEYLKSSSQPSEIKLKELPRGILFGLNAQDSILPIILKYVDAGSTLKWLASQAANSTTMSFLVDESTLKIHCKRSDNLCNSGWMWNGSWLFGVQSTQPGQAEIMEQLAKYLRAKFSSVQALTRNIRPPMLSYLNFMHLPDTVLSDFNRFCAEETRKDGVSTRATWCLVMPTNPPTKLAHLPKPGELAFFVDFSISRISLVFKIMAADGTHRILPLHYNYKTRFVGLWKPEPNPDDLTLEDASNPFFQAKVKQLAEDASLPSLEKIFLKLSRTNVPLDKGGPEKAFQAVRYVITKYSSVASELSE